MGRIDQSSFLNPFFLCRQAGRIDSWEPSGGGLEEAMSRDLGTHDAWQT